jgi:DNA-binding HxlR family transcriptional regulator
MKTYTVTELTHNVKLIDDTLVVRGVVYPVFGPRVIKFFKDMGRDDIDALLALLALPEQEAQEVKDLAEEV